jgi:protein-tyrosine kinase
MVKPAQASWVGGAGEHGWIRGIKASKLKGKGSLGRMQSYCAECNIVFIFARGWSEMERIKQALERAREERRQTGANQLDILPTHVSGRPSTLPQARPLETPPLSPKPNIVPRITYTQTCMIEVSPERLRERRVAVGMKEDAVADVYKVLRTRILHRMRAKGWNSLAITSVGANNGKTLTAVNLAISLARGVNQTVLLVDLDLRRPRVARYFTEKRLPGLSDYLLHGTPLAQILFNPGIERLVILPGNKPMVNSSEMLSSPAMVNLVQDLKTRYVSRLVLFDMPPLIGTDDMLAFLPYTDAVLLVVEEGKTHREELVRAQELLQETNFLGTVLNKSADPVSKYY